MPTDTGDWRRQLDKLRTLVRLGTVGEMAGSP
jgi:hypothetical protein